MKKRWIALGLPILVVAVQGGCCLTPAMWDAQRMEPIGIEGGVVSADGFVWMDIRTDSASSQRLCAHLHLYGDRWCAEDEEWRASGDQLPPGEVLGILTEEPPFMSSPDRWFALMRPDDREPYISIWSPGGRHSTRVDLDMPVDWSRASAWLSGAATPVTVLLDAVVFGPIHFAGIIGTAGGHGEPWCGFCSNSGFGSG